MSELGFLSVLHSIEEVGAYLLLAIALALANLIATTILGILPFSPYVIIAKLVILFVMNGFVLYGYDKIAPDCDDD
jgi:type III secretory pathway component EscU